jgi:heme/copper-type cytochrome/quinol oxidase subunit 2
MASPVRTEWRLKEVMPGVTRYVTLGAGRSAFRGLAWIGGAVASVCAIAAGAVLALVFAASVVVILLMAGVILTLVAFAVRARRSVVSKPASEPDVIEARNIGGHSWVAYGWDGRR